MAFDDPLEPGRGCCQVPRVGYTACSLLRVLYNIGLKTQLLDG